MDHLAVNTKTIDSWHLKQWLPFFGGGSSPTAISAGDVYINSQHAQICRYTVGVLGIESDIFIEIYTQPTQMERLSLRNYVRVTSLLRRLGVLLVFLWSAGQSVARNEFFFHDSNHKELEFMDFMRRRSKMSRVCCFGPSLVSKRALFGSVVRGRVIALSTLFTKTDVWYENEAKQSQSPHRIAVPKRSKHVLSGLMRRRLTEEAWSFTMFNNADMRKKGINLFVVLVILTKLRLKRGCCCRGRRLVPLPGLRRPNLHRCGAEQWEAEGTILNFPSGRAP